MKGNSLGGLSRQAVSGWVEDRAGSMGAALAYYTAFSLAPLLIIVIAVAGLFFGHDAAQQALVGQLQGLLGDTGGKAVEDMLQASGGLGHGIMLIVGVVTLLLGATTAFVELQDDLDRIWKAPPREGSGILNFLRSRLLSFGMVLFIGFLLIVSLALSAAVAAVGDALFGGAEWILHVLTFLVSFAVITALFAMIYKVLPNAPIDWSNVWTGAAITALLFEIGKYLIGLYIGKSSVASSFGAAGPFVVLMLWIYYSTQIFLLGAEFTAAHAKQQQGERRDTAGDTAGATAHPAVPIALGPIADTRTGFAATPATEASGAAASVSRVPWPVRLVGAGAVGLAAGFTLTRLVLTRGHIHRFQWRG